MSAAIMKRSPIRRALSISHSKHTLLLSIPVMAELEDVLSRPKFDRYITPAERRHFLSSLLDRAVLCEIREQIDICRDPTDNKFLELAASGDASYLVTGDRDLLVLDPSRAIRIVTPRDFLKLIGAAE